MIVPTATANSFPSIDLHVEDDRQLAFEARVLDVSRSGIRLATSLPLPQGAHIRITFRRPSVILGEVRHCKRVAEAYQVGVEIKDVAVSPNRHLDDELALYVSGKGLTEAEFFYVRMHVSECRTCERRVLDREELGTARPQPFLEQ